MLSSHCALMIDCSQSFREVSYALVPVPDIQDFLKSTTVISSEDEHYNLSLRCEARTPSSLVG